MSFKPLQDIPSPEQLREECPVSCKLAARKLERDRELAAVIQNQTNKFLVIVGPCSASNEDAVCDYASRLSKVNQKLNHKLFIIPRIYTAKPRTNGYGYKGILHYPEGSTHSDLVKGIRAARNLHLRVAGESGLTTADELLYPEAFAYFQDIVSYLAIGARSVEDQQHRFVSSGVDCPVGMKNPTNGNPDTLLYSIFAAQQGHKFIYRDREVKSSGNPLAHAIIRGYENFMGEYVPNYQYDQLLKIGERYRKQKLKNPFIICDVNHANSGKDYSREPMIIYDVLESRRRSEEIGKMVRGVMIESFIEAGRQEISGNVYGKSVTDGCLGWNETEELLHYIAEHV